MRSVLSLSFWPFSDEGEGRRPHQLALEDAAAGRGVVYVSTLPTDSSAALAAKWMRRASERYPEYGNISAYGHDRATETLIPIFPRCRGRVQYEELFERHDIAYGRSHDPSHDLVGCFEMLRKHRIAGIYDQRDNWQAVLQHFGASVFDRTSRPGGPGIEERYLEMATGITPVTAYLQGQLRGQRPSKVIPNAASRLVVQTAHGLGQTPASDRRPIALCTGIMADSAFDWELCYRLATECPHVEFQFVGDVRSYRANGSRTITRWTEATLGLPNVTHIDWIAQSELIPKLRQATIALIPRPPSPTAFGMSPLKVYEYVASGLPVVSTDLPQISGLPLVHTAKSTTEMVRLVQDLVTRPPSPFDLAAAAEFTANNTWADRALAMWEFAESLQAK